MARFLYLGATSRAWKERGPELDHLESQLRRQVFQNSTRVSNAAPNQMHGTFSQGRDNVKNTGNKKLQSSENLIKGSIETDGGHNTADSWNSILSVAQGRGNFLRDVRNR